MKTKKIIKICALLLASVIIFTQISAIVTAVDENPVNIDNLLYKAKTAETAKNDPKTIQYIKSLPGEKSTPQQLIAKVVFYILVVANILAFVSFLIAGIFMIISQGNDDDIKKAKGIFLYTVMAMIICAIALAVVTGITKLNFFS